MRFRVIGTIHSRILIFSLLPIQLAVAFYRTFSRFRPALADIRALGEVVCQ